MQFTVKQLADILSVSKGTITNYSNQLNLKLEKNSHGVIILSLDQCIAIAEAINENRTELNKVNAERLYKIRDDSKIKMADELKEKFNADTSKAEAQSYSNNDDLIEILKKQIDDLKQDKEKYEQQLQVKDSQIKQLNDTLNNQQSLQLQSNEEIKALKVELKEVKEDSTKQDTTDVSVNVPANTEADTSNQNIKNFYSDLKEDRNNKSFISRLFKRL
ncbi:DUF536 domain-containing protein [Macrococcoides caseolyticum]|uniref:DUF536 domain-containing protein n=1 Tax=Macrococcoides caseolyticum TaxID=69966 RepID=UPI000C3449E9|nr:DUF536 domain-containing protein [Macrococcus caseolyticus]PKE05785.1 hypothetical protein CW692_11700 [Macrococcus caseolyticus]PKE09928.1 hypothetical protein CW685_11430 [Macrococcus caseolyticus]PKE18392.1 hypothetical protein CW679_11195 [Macrococcus caseolyticus]PKE20720.1 hypothetical protein CW688_11075 [Macrococcus caseolyticus]PKE22953.1 hypothetical protein CW689_11785 [Macrococcus caseolyticus]